MSGDFKRGHFGADGDQDAEGASAPEDAWPGCGGKPLPPSGRDVAVTFWESIGMKPGDDWQVRADKRK